MSSYNFSLLLAHIQWSLSNIHKCTGDNIDAEAGAPILWPPDRKNWPTGKNSDAGKVQFSSPQSLSHVRLLATPWTVPRQASLAITNSRSVLKLMSIEPVMPSNHLILHRPLLLLPSIFPSIRVFSNESILPIRWPDYWSFSFNISPSDEHSGLISFRFDWLDLLAVKGTLKSLLQHHSSIAAILRHSAFFPVHFHNNTRHWENHTID